MAEPSTLYLECPDCGEFPHRILSGRFGSRRALTFQGIVKCSNCGQVRNATHQETKPVKVMFVVSILDRTSQTLTDWDPKEPLRVGGEVRLEEELYEVTRIDPSPRGRNAVFAKEVRSVWVKHLPREVEVPYSLSVRQRTVSGKLRVPTEARFGIGEVLTLPRGTALVHRIRLLGRTVRKGDAQAAQIKRLYLRAPQERART